MSRSASTKFSTDPAKQAASEIGKDYAAEMGFTIAGEDRYNKKATPTTEKTTSSMPVYSDLLDAKVGSNPTGPQGWQTFTTAARNDVEKGAGASGNYVDKANEHLRSDPTTSPDFIKNWVNEGDKREFANMHARPITNKWARMADAFNNHRWWNPGNAHDTGAVGLHGGSAISGEGGHGERWEPITTQELEAQDRAEDYESSVREKGIERQNLYSMYPYDTHKLWQDRQMTSNYQLDLNMADYELRYGELMRKTAALQGATGVYGRALWALAGVGGYHMNDYDRKVMEKLAQLTKNPNISMDELAQNVGLLFKYSAQVQAQKMGTTVEVVLNAVQNALASGKYGALPENAMMLLNQAMGRDSGWVNNNF